MSTRVRACAFGLALMFAGCDEGSSPPRDGGRVEEDSGPLPTCDAPGNYTRVRGGTSASACGTTLSPFDDATATITESAGGFLLTVQGTGPISDVTDCPATLSGDELTATCVHDDGSSATYRLRFDCIGFSGMTSITTAGGGCTLPWSVEGDRS